MERAGSLPNLNKFKLNYYYVTTMVPSYGQLMETYSHFNPDVKKNKPRKSVTMTISTWRDYECVVEFHHYSTSITYLPIMEPIGIVTNFENDDSIDDLNADNNCPGDVHCFYDSDIANNCGSDRSYDSDMESNYDSDSDSMFYF